VARIEGVLNGPQASDMPSVPRHSASGPGAEFKQLLHDLGKSARIRFSKHAVQRMSSRGISLDKQKIEKLDAAMNAARSKGANESLVLMDELALVVSVRNRTVITAMSSSESRGNVFTSIDSTVVA
jgi:flagellar operon protein